MSGFTSGMRSSATCEWATPKDLFAELDAEFAFDLDVASTDANALCERHYTRAEDGLRQPWEGSVWCNPPYGREIGKWVRRAAETNAGGGSRSASSPRGRIRRGGTIGSWATRQRYASYAGGSGSGTRRQVPRSRLPWSCTTRGRSVGGR